MHFRAKFESWQLYIYMCAGLLHLFSYCGIDCKIDIGILASFTSNICVPHICMHACPALEPQRHSRSLPWITLQHLPANV